MRPRTTRFRGGRYHEAERAYQGVENVGSRLVSGHALIIPVDSINSTPTRPDIVMSLGTSL